ncbi:MAG: hypothetical protein ABW352_07745 [Polyangiales bacterium]
MLSAFSKRSLAFLFAAALAGGACGDDSGDGDDTGGGDTDSGTPTGKSYTSTLVGITATNADAPILVSHRVELLDAEEKPLNPPIVNMTSSTDGKVTSTPPEAAKSIYVTGVGVAGGGMSTYDTIVANHNWESGETLLRISSAGTLMVAETTGGFTANAERAAVTGAIYWTTDGKLRKGAVGCAKVYIDGAKVPDEDASQRYVAMSGLPAKLADQDHTFPGRGQFYIGNMKTGNHTIKVSMDDGATFIGEKTFYVGKTRAQASSPTKSVLYQLGVDIVAPANPTPASCTK